MKRQQRLVLVVSILASLVAFLDSSVVNVALPAIAKELGGGLTTQQWVVDAYLMSLGSLILIAGSLSDIFGRIRVLRAGLVGFAVTSLLCAIAPNAAVLIIARALQGVSGALLVPSSLALIMSRFDGKSQGKAIGSWTAWTGTAFIVGPLLGGFLVDSYSWRLIFAINLLSIAVTLWLLALLRKDEATINKNRVDILGAALGALGLAATVFALIEQGRLGWYEPIIYSSLALGIFVLGLFLRHESNTRNAMLPLSFFKIRNFAVGNIATFSIYAGISVATFLVVVFLQQVGKFSATESGLALIPVTLVMFLLSSRFGALASKYGPRWFMGFGPLLASFSFIMMTNAELPVQYWTQFFPAITLFGVALSITVAPLTSAILGSISAKQAGIGSAINNAVARIAGLLAVAALGTIIGTSVTIDSFHRGIFATAILMAVGGVVSIVGIQNKQT